MKIKRNKKKRKIKAKKRKMKVKTKIKRRRKNKKKSKNRKKKKRNKKKRRKRKTRNRNNKKINRKTKGKIIKKKKEDKKDEKKDEDKQKQQENKQKDEKKDNKKELEKKQQEKEKDKEKEKQEEDKNKSFYDIFRSKDENNTSEQTVKDSTDGKEIVISTTLTVRPKSKESKITENKEEEKKVSDLSGAGSAIEQNPNNKLSNKLSEDKKETGNSFFDLLYNFSNKKYQTKPKDELYASGSLSAKAKGENENNAKKMKFWGYLQDIIERN